MRKAWERSLRTALKRLVELGACYDSTNSFDEETKIDEEIEEIIEWIIEREDCL